jgi:tRNA (guanine37-N1)-methyltransferase
VRNHNLSTLLKDRLSQEELNLVYKSYDIIGDIAVIRVPEELKSKAAVIAEALMQLHTNVKTVLRQSSAVNGEFRLRRLEHVASEKKTVTTHREHGCVFSVDLGKCYFSPRLSHERIRIAQLVRPHEVVVNMFAGVGSFSIIIAKHSQVEKVYSIDVNPVACQYMQGNVLLSHVLNHVISMKGDAKTVIMERFQSTADRVLMPLPEKAYDYLDYAVAALKPEGGWIHYYDFEHAGGNENPIEKVTRKISCKLSQLDRNFSVPFGRILRDVGPRWQQVVVDIQIGEKNITFDKSFMLRSG